MSEAAAVQRVVVAAHAKVNLVLDLVGPRPDGYTEIATVFQTVDLADEVTLELASTGQGITLRTAGEEPCPPEQNLAFRAARLFADEWGLPGALSITLVKRIPAGAGLGGGSSDAAAVLRGLAGLVGGADPGRLHALAASLGADVPFFLLGGTALGRGRGDELERLPDLPRWPIVLARAGRPLATADVYRAARSRLTASGVAPNIQRFLWHLREKRAELPPLANGLSPAAEEMEPWITRLVSRLAEDGGRSCMTGSGSTVFALFEEEARARAAAARLAATGDVTFVHCTWTRPGNGG